MDKNWLNNGGGIAWRWNWTELCGYPGGIQPLNPETHDLGVCFQQLCLQIPVLMIIAVISAYYCGKRNWSGPYQYSENYIINIRILITVCLAVLPIIRGYIILSNTILLPTNNLPSRNEDTVSMQHLHELLDKGTNTTSVSLDLIDGVNTELDSTDNYTKSTIPPEAGARTMQEFLSEPYSKDPNIRVKDKASAAKPIDYLVAGTEGLAWVVHLCFILSLRKGRNANPRGPVLMRALILLLIVISILLLRSHIKDKPKDDVLPNLSLGFSISVVTLLILYAATLIPGQSSSSSTQSSRYREFPDEQDSTYLGTAMEDATVASRLLFHWVNPLLKKGVQGSLNHSDDLFELPEYISTSFISQRIDKYLEDAPQAGNESLDSSGGPLTDGSREVVHKKVTLLRLLHKCFGWEFYAVGILKFVADCSSFVGPIMLNRLIDFIENKNTPNSYGYLYATLIFISALIGSFCSAHFTFWMSVVGLKIRATVITLVYRKTLHSSSVELNRQFNYGEITNFMSTDADRLVNSCPSFHTLWSIPLQLAVTLYLLYGQIGMSFLAGVAFAIVLIPINKIIANKIGNLSCKLMEWKDQRVRLIGEALRGITTIKLNVWEEHFLRNILKLREKELRYLAGRKYLDALCVYFWATTPVLIAILTFGTYVLSGHELDAKTVFTSMALLNMLIGPLNAFPWVLNGLTEAWVSLKRIQRLLDLPDADALAYYSQSSPGIELMFDNVTLTASGRRSSETMPSKTCTPTDAVPPSSSVGTVKTVSFEDENGFSLQDINVNIEKGALVGVMGKVGSGKSLLLNGVLGEIRKVRGRISVRDLANGFAYVGQSPWLQRGSIRDNILFGKAYDYNKYKNVLEACALPADLNVLPKRDLTTVGEAGNTLSGGQKTRIALARAVYADKEVYLLDDVLATLDPKVANYVFEHVILALLRHKTRILCTHQTKYLIHADLVLEMSRGRIVRQGKPSDILSDMLEDYLLSSESIESDFEVSAMSGSSRETDERVAKTESEPLLDQEFTEKGNLQFGVYICYIKAIGRYLALSIFLSMILMQSSKNITDLWLSYWVTHSGRNNSGTINATGDRSEPVRLESVDVYSYGQNNSDYFLVVYGLLGLVNSVFTLVRAYLFAYGGIEAATSLHKQLLKIVLRAKPEFFDTQPFGRIINRFSSDSYTIDDSLPFISNILLAQLFGLIGTVIVTGYGLPWIFLVLAPLVPIYHWVQNHYRLTSRELKRLSSKALSPLYAQFNETLMGLSSIRAFRTISRFKQENELLLETSQKAQFASVAVGQWLALRLQFVGVALLAGVSVMAVLQHQYDFADPGLIGLAITYTLSITGLLTGVVNAFTETEREMIAVERVKEYLENVSMETVAGQSPPYAWPSQGVVEFREVVLQYREHLTPSLNGISFITRPAEKIGVVGRTGAGKSSLLASLFRLREISSGSISIDNVNIRSLQLNALRSRLAIIPQNPFLFSGTIRENVDPLNQYPDLHIYKILEKCKVHSLVYRLGGLGAVLDESGGNLSAGQRQLFCLVRAVLQNAKIVCIDEATANVDQETDKFIQGTIKSFFQSATVITVAHRIRTIMHCDRVLVMEEGELVEFDEPNLLIQNTDSYFYNLASQEFSDKE